MKYNLALLTADVKAEMKKIEKLAEDFKKVEHKLSLTPEKVPFYDRAAIGYYLHNFYNGCENIFRSIARFFENDLEPQSWHRDLLKRMVLDIEGFRPPVVDRHLFDILNDFRSFRHVYRQCYAFELDWERERLVAEKLTLAQQMMEKQIGRFLELLHKIED